MSAGSYEPGPGNLDFLFGAYNKTSSLQSLLAALVNKINHLEARLDGVAASSDGSAKVVMSTPVAFREPAAVSPPGVSPEALEEGKMRQINVISRPS